MISDEIILSVSQLTQAIKLHLEKQFPQVVVQGEISNFKRQSSGHLYFTLKDSNAQIQCAMFRSYASSLKIDPKDGDQIEVRGMINVYPPRGNYQIVVQSLKAAGLGELLQLLEERKAKFLKRGFFDPGLKKPLPNFPKVIGIVTSPTGAVISDILQILHRRAHGFSVLLNPVKVQGEGAAKEIAKAIKDFNEKKLCDVLIVGRGGGSIEDLWAFNEECVIEAIVASRIPIITAIGHETDTTLSDLAADLRAPTPSAAAELVLAEKNEHLNFIFNMRAALQTSLRHKISFMKEKLERILHHPFMKSPKSIWQMHAQKVDEYELLLEKSFLNTLAKTTQKIHNYQVRCEQQKPHLKIQKKRFELQEIQKAIDVRLKNKIQQKSFSLEKLTTHLLAINPKKILEKGYSILFDEKDNCAIVSAKNLSVGQHVKFLLKDGEASGQIQNIHQAVERGI